MFFSKLDREYIKNYEQFNANNGIEEVVFDQETLEELGVSIEGIDEEDFDIVKIVMGKSKWLTFYRKYRRYQKISKELKLHFFIVYKMLINVQNELSELQLERDNLNRRHNKLKDYNQTIKDEVALIRKENDQLAIQNKNI